MIGGASLRFGLLGLWCVAAAGCAEMTNVPAAGAIATVGPPPVAVTPSAADDAATSAPASSAPVPALAGSTENPLDEQPVASGTEPAPPSPATADVPSGTADLAVAARAAPATRESEAPPPGINPSPIATPKSAGTLDFSSLVARLRNTKAISLLTKVAVKNESDDLLAEFRAYHKQHGVATLADLRRSYDLLFHKLYSLLQDADPPLARDIDRSRAAIWELLADPRKFSASHLMAGA
jgi:hypothetical protein